MFRRTFIALTAATFLTAPAFAAGHSKDIVDTAVGAGNFGTLVAAVEAAGLVDTLKGEGPFTVFAPTDAAFEALPEGTVEDLLKPENKEKLTSILTYHVVAGKVMSLPGYLVYAVKKCSEIIGNLQGPGIVQGTPFFLTHRICLHTGIPDLKSDEQAFQ